MVSNQEQIYNGPYTVIEDGNSLEGVSFLSESSMRLKKQCSNWLFWAENLNFLAKTVNKLIKFSAQDSDLAQYFEPQQTFWQKATIKTERWVAAYM